LETRPEQEADLDAIAPASLRAADLSPLQRLADLAAEDMAKVDAIILDRMDSPVPLIPALAAHLINAGGKRLRPMLTVAAARLCGYQGVHHHKLAATVEFIHTATLLHDDVVDGSDLRRGKKAANLVWGNPASVLVGDFLFSRAFTLMVETENLRVLEILSRASSVIAEGEVRQLAALNNVDTTIQEYMQIVESKTAVLFAAATEVGGVIAGASADKVSALERYGLELGLAFQLVDDALDYGGASPKLGKSVGDDFREGKVTLPAALAIARAQDGALGDERAFWTRVIGQVDQRPGDFERALELITARGGLVDTLKAAREHAETAKAALRPFPEGDLKRALQALPDFVVERAY
jgi:octaprenyl-diphosphate synthase